jgi:hypothetical protein
MRRLRHKRLAAPTIVLVLALAGCGGAAVTVQEVPGGPVELKLPAGADELNPDATASPTPSATPTVAADAQATTVPDTTQQNGQAPADTAQGTTDQTTPDQGTTDGTTTDKPPAAGSPDDQLEDYCANNPGAC